MVYRQSSQRCGICIQESKAHRSSQRGSQVLVGARHGYQILEGIPDDALQENIAKDLGVKGDWSADYGDFARSDIPQTPPIDEGLDPEEMEGPPDDLAPEDDIDNENSLYVLWHQ